MTKVESHELVNPQHHPTCHKPGLDMTVNNTALANGAALTESQLTSELISEIPFRSADDAANTIYVIYLPPNATTPTLAGAFAYHNVVNGDAHDPNSPNAKANYFYAVIGYSALADGSLNFDSVNISASHEIDETVTDPTTNQGWRETQGPRVGDEIGDICNRNPSDFSTYTIQQIWDQNNCKCVDRVAQPAAPLAPQNCGVSVGCNESVEVNCDMINEPVVLQRQVSGKWQTVSSDSEVPRFHIPFLSDQPATETYAIYPACGTNSHDDLVCAPNISTTIPHTACGGGGGGFGNPVCGGKRKPPCLKKKYK